MKNLILIFSLLLSLPSFSSLGDKNEILSRANPRYSKLFRKKMDRISKLLGKKQYDKAIGLLTTMISSSSLNSDKAEFLAQRGRVQAIKGSYDMAEKDLLSAMDLKVLPAKPTFQILEYLAQIALNKEQTKKSLEYLDLLIGLNSKPSPKTFVLKISILAQDKKYPQALSLIKKVLGQKVVLKEDWMALFSGVYVMAGHPQKALPLLKKLIQINPGKANYWTQLTSVYLSANKPKQALSTLRAAYEMGHLKTDQEISRLADLFSYLKIPFSAASLLEKELGKFEAKSKEKAVEKIFSQYKYAREIALAEKIVNKQLQKSSTKKLHYELALLRIAAQDWQKALSSLIKAKGHKEKAAEIHFALGLTYFNINKLEQAKVEFNKAHSLNHKNAQSWLNQLAQL